jgi:hypothetical protein
MLTSRHAAYALVAVAIILGFLLFGIVVANAQVLGPLADSIFDRFDANHDGILSREEIKAARATMFDRIDTDHTGMDANHDGKITRDEFVDSISWFDRIAKNGGISKQDFARFLGGTTDLWAMAIEIGAVLAALDSPAETWRPAPRFWIASAGVTALSFAAGFLLMRALTNISPDLPLAVIGLATGQADIGGLL